MRSSFKQGINRPASFYQIDRLTTRGPKRGSVNNTNHWYTLCYLHFVNTLLIHNFVNTFNHDLV